MEKTNRKWWQFWKPQYRNVFHPEFLPRVSFNGGSTGITYSMQEARYTLKGDPVRVSGQIILKTDQAVKRDDA